MRAASCWSSRSSANPISRTPIPPNSRDRTSQDRTHAQLRAVMVLAAQQRAALGVRLATIVVGACFVMSCAAATDASEFEQEKRANLTALHSIITIRMKTERSLYDCPCTVTGPYGCITAAHCVERYAPREVNGKVVLVREKMRAIYSWPDGETTYKASQWIPNPAYRRANPPVWDVSQWNKPRGEAHDVAVVFFNKPFNLPFARLIPANARLKNDCGYSLYGFSKEHDLLRTFCLVSQPRNAWHGYVGNMVGYGDSGGPVFPKTGRSIIGFHSTSTKLIGQKYSPFSIIAPVALNREWLTPMVALTKKRR